MMRNSRSMSRQLSAFCTAAILLPAVAGFSYNPLQEEVNGTPAPSRWPNASVTYYINPTIGSNISTTGGTAQNAIDSAFSTWKRTPAPFNGQVLTNIQATDAGSSSQVVPNATDCLNVIGFEDTNRFDFPTGAIAFTEILAVSPGPGAPYSCSGKSETSVLPSQIVDADIEFNPQVQFTTSLSPGANQFDLQSVATHEIGHLLGLDHSGLAEAVMFPFGDTTAAGERRSLSLDDLLGVAFLYPAPSFAASTGELSGTVALSGKGAFAAQVLVVDASNGNVVMDRLTNPDGTFDILGVPPGTYNLLVLPLAPNENVGLYTLDDFSGWACGYTESRFCASTLSNPTNYTGKFF